MSYVEVCQKHGQHHTEICGECFDDLKEENAKLREALEFTISAADYLYKTESPVPRGLAPMFYHSLSYEGDVELVEKTKKARAALEGK